MRLVLSLLVALSIGGVVASFCVVVIDEREHAFRTVLGDPDSALNFGRAVLSEPGIYLRVPGVHVLDRYDKRLQRYEAADTDELQLAGNYVMEVDYFVVWQISDPRLFREKVGAGDLLRLLDDTTFNELRTVLAGVSIGEFLSAKRAEITAEIARRADGKLRPQGIGVFDFQIRRTDLPDANLARAFERMRSERARVAKKYRAEGEEQARKIRAEADRESTVLRAEADRRSSELRGEGDSKATQIYAEAYAQDREFYSFQRSLEAYRSALDDSTTLVLSPKSPFLKHFFTNGVAPGVAAPPPTR